MFSVTMLFAQGVSVRATNGVLRYPMLYNPTSSAPRFQGSVTMDNLPANSGAPSGWLQILPDHTLQTTLNGSTLTNLTTDTNTIVAILKTTNVVNRLLVSDTTPQDRYRWINMTNGQITFSGWNADVTGTVPGIYWKGTNGTTVQGQIDVNSDHQAGQVAELRILTDYDMALAWGYNREMQLGISGGQYNQKVKVQYADQVGNSHMFVFRARTNNVNNGFAVLGYHPLTSSASTELDFYDVEPTWNNFPTAGFLNPGHKLAKWSTNGSWVTSSLRADGGFVGNGIGITNMLGWNTNIAAANSISNNLNITLGGNVTVSGTLIAGSLQSTLDGSATIWDHTSFAGASAGQELFDAFAIAGNKMFGIQSQPNDVQQPTNIFFRVDYPTKQKYGLGSFATNYIANANTAGYTNSRAAPGIGGTNNMVARVVGTSGTLEFYNRSGEYGVTVCGVGVFTNTISSSTWHIPIPVNSGFIIRSGVGVDIQVYAQ